MFKTSFRNRIRKFVPPIDASWLGLYSVTFLSDSDDEKKLRLAGKTKNEFPNFLWTKTYDYRLACGKK